MVNQSPDFAVALGGMLRRRRRWLDITQKELCGRLGITQSAYCTWEKGQSVPTLIPFLAAIRALNIDIADVYRVLDGAEPNGGENEAA